MVTKAKEDINMIPIKNKVSEIKDKQSTTILSMLHSNKVNKIIPKSKVILSTDIVKRLIEMFDRVNNENFNQEISDESNKIYANYAKPVTQKITTLFGVLLGDYLNINMPVTKEEENMVRTTINRILKIRIKLLTITLMHELAYHKTVAVDIQLRQVYDYMDTTIIDLSENNDPQKGPIRTMKSIVDYIVTKYKQVMVYLREILFLLPKEYPIGLYPLPIDTLREILNRIIRNTMIEKQSDITILCTILHNPELLPLQEHQKSQWKSYSDEINTLLYFFLINGVDLKTFERLYMEKSYFINTTMESLVQRRESSRYIKENKDNIPTILENSPHINTNMKSLLAISEQTCSKNMFSNILTAMEHNIKILYYCVLHRIVSNITVPPPPPLPPSIPLYISTRSNTIPSSITPLNPSATFGTTIPPDTINGNTMGIVPPNSAFPGYSSSIQGNTIGIISPNMSIPSSIAPIPNIRLTPNAISTTSRIIPPILPLHGPSGLTQRSTKTMLSPNKSISATTVSRSSSFTNVVSIPASILNKKEKKKNKKQSINIGNNAIEKDIPLHNKETNNSVISLHKIENDFTQSEGKKDDISIMIKDSIISVQEKNIVENPSNKDNVIPIQNEDNNNGIQKDILAHNVEKTTQSKDKQENTSIVENKSITPINSTDNVIPVQNEDNNESHC